MSSPRSWTIGFNGIKYKYSTTTLLSTLGGFPSGMMQWSASINSPPSSLRWCLLQLPVGYRVLENLRRLLFSVLCLIGQKLAAIARDLKQLYQVHVDRKCKASPKGPLRFIFFLLGNQHVSTTGRSRPFIPHIKRIAVWRWWCCVQIRLQWQPKEGAYNQIFS